MLKLALRNLWRNPKRSSITLAAITVGIWGLVFTWAFIDGINEQMITNNIQYLTGHIKVHKAGYHQDKRLAIALDESSLNKLQEIKQAQAITPRVEGGALISAGKNSATVMVYGVDTEREKRVTTLHKTIVSGAYLVNEEPGIVIGDSLARELNVRVSDLVDVIVQAADGSIGADRLNVVGIYNSGIDMLDENLVMMPLVTAQEIYSLWGRFNSAVIKLDKRSQVPYVERHLNNRLGDTFEVYTWQRLLPSVVQSVEFHEAVGYVVLFIVFIVVAAGIANTLLMAVMERIKEFGVMQALGTQRRQIIALVLWESLFLALMGLLIGNLLGVGFTYYWSMNGMDLSAYTKAMETMPGLSSVVYPLLRVDHLILISSIVFVICLVPALYPAWHASGLSPVVAIKGLTPHAPIAFRFESLIRIPQKWLWWQLAWRNLFRNPKRSFITGGATAFGMAAFIFLYAFADGFFEQMVRNSTNLLSSHIQIREPKQGKDERLFNADVIPNEVIANDRVAASAQRINLTAMLSSATKALPVNWIGVNPEQETQITSLHTLIEKGSYLKSSEDGIVLGRAIANDLKVSVGQKVVVTTQDPQGNLVSTALRINGIFYSGSELFDRGFAMAPIDTIRRLLELEPTQVSHVALKLKDRSTSQSIASELTTHLNKLGLKALAWQEILPVVVQMIDMTKVDFYLILGVIFVVVAIGVMNTMLMSVLERVKEFGMLLSLGTSPDQVIRTVLYESILLGLSGLAFGAILGVGLALYFGHTGIDLSAFTKSMAAIPGMTDKVYPVLIVKNLVLPSILLFVIGLLVSVYPAIKAGSLKPVEAIHGK